jgi:hypothetical protein
MWTIWFVTLPALSQPLSPFEKKKKTLWIHITSQMKKGRPLDEFFQYSISKVQTLSLFFPSQKKLKPNRVPYSCHQSICLQPPSTSIFNFASDPKLKKAFFSSFLALPCCVLPVVSCLALFWFGFSRLVLSYLALCLVLPCLGLSHYCDLML